jgi:feruloyl esterase
VAPAINFEVWMPVADWNGRFQGVGGGGYAGVISYPAMAVALRQGYATASTDTGHVAGGEATWALGRTDLITDFAYRAIHETTVNAKAIIRAFQERDASRSYFVGCSQGGRQGYLEAQRYPADYDGIVAGAPAQPWTRLMLSMLWIGTAALKDPASGLPPGKLRLVHDSVLSACDALDGAVDGLLENPRRCRFDPAALLCKGPDSETCLTAAQVETVKKIYAPVRNKKGEKLYTGLPPGSELGWTALAGSTLNALPAQFYKYFVFNDPKWDWRTFDFDKDVALTESKLGSLIDATGSGLRDFRARGGKIIAYHGWNDQLVSAESSIDYYNQVARPAAGGKAPDDFYRLFLAPGMMHCQGGGAPDTFNMMPAIEAWVERGIAPDKVVASHSSNGVVDRTRPLCPFPQVAKYKGTGSIDDAAYFACSIEAGQPANVP